MQQLFRYAGIVLYTFLLPCTYLNAQGDTARADASLTSATVYFGYGAELNHELKVKLTPGTRTIVINQLSTTADLSSLQISLPEDVALLSQRFSVYQPVAPIVPKSTIMQKLEDSIEAVQKDIGRINNLVAIQQEILTKTGLLIETTVTTSGNKTVTSAEVLKLLDYYNAIIEKAKTRIYNYQQDVAAHNKRITELRRQAAEALPVTPAKLLPYGQVMLQVMCRQGGEFPVSLSYYTARAGWTATYDVRVNSKSNKVKLVYKALLTQTTGVEWKQTKLTLSTGTPTFGAAAPVLTPWHLQFYVPGLYKNLQRNVALNNLRRNDIQSFDDKKLSEVIAANKDEQLYFGNSNDSNINPSTLNDYTVLSQGQLNSNYEIALPYDISSDGQLNSVNMKEQEIDCSLKNYAVPRLDREAYLLAEIANWQNLDLLPGDANIIMDDTYIGRSRIDPNSTADTLNLSLGRDKRVAVKRVLVKELSSLKTNGSVSRQVFTYELQVKNNKITDVNLLLKDQFPLSTLKDVEVVLDEFGDAMVNRESGVLTWKLELKPGESRKVRFTYTIKYPKDKKLI